MRLTKRELLELVASLPEWELKRELINRVVKSGEFSELDVAEILVYDIEANSAEFEETIKSDTFLEFLWRRFHTRPRYLARALVRYRPDVFYTTGFAFRLILKLRANLGPVLIKGQQGGKGAEEVSRYIAELPEMTRSDILELDQESTFREHLYFMSRDPEIGLQILDEGIASADTEYERTILTQVRNRCVELLDMKFPGFVDTVGGYMFPAFHVRWWLKESEKVSRVLNSGDTGAYKTSYAVLSTQMAGCKHVLVICTAHARVNWSREIGIYFEQPDDGRVRVVRKKSDLQSGPALYTIVGYNTLIQDGVVDALLSQSFDGLVWDEAHYGKHLSEGEGGSQRAKATARLIRGLSLTKLLALTATPWENHPKEFAAIASALRPDIFPTAESFRQARPEDPRFLRELFAGQILEVDVPEIRDLPKISPNPSEDLFGAVPIQASARHLKVYEHVRESGDVFGEYLEPSQKVARLLLAAIHPHRIQHQYEWPDDLEDSFDDWGLSTKLLWIRERTAAELKKGAKVVVATGIFTEGITYVDDDEEIWVGDQLRQWFGEAAVLILDGSVSQAVDRDGSSERDRLIGRWRSDPEARILLVSMRSCPDSVNLSVPAMEGVSKLFLTAISYPWVPWKQFLGRFWRQGLGVPLEYAVPVLQGTLDENLLHLAEDKWEPQQLFRGMVALTPEELDRMDKEVQNRRLGEEARSDIERVNIINARMRGLGEEGAERVLQDTYGMSTNGEALAKAFLSVHGFAAPGHIARFMCRVIMRFIAEGLVHPEGIFDAGCGPLTLERYLELPVYGVDLNQHMVEIGSRASRHGGVNARVGRLSDLPKEWDGKFELTVASLVLDWTSAKQKVAGSRLPERYAILAELIRVTHPQGRIWITATQGSLTEGLLKQWVRVLRKQGFVIVPELTGLVRATDDLEHDGDFAFWSLCFVPNGNTIFTIPKKGLTYVFEDDRIKTKRGGSGAQSSPDKRKKVHAEFEVVQVDDGAVLDAQEAAEAASARETQRLIQKGDLSGWKFHRIPRSVRSDWRVLNELRKRGILDLD